MLKHYAIAFMATLVSISVSSAYAELSRSIVDPLESAVPPASEVDSTVLQRRLLKSDLDTEAPLMIDPSEDGWWLQFHDPILNDLIRKTAQNNLNLRTAIHSIESSRYALQKIKSGYYPTVSASALYQKGQTSGTTMHGHTTSPVRENFTGLSLDLNWEIDVFGRIRKQSEAAGATYNASRAEYMATLTSLCAQVASVYFDLAAARQLHATAISHLESQNRVLDITNARLEAGISSKLDVSQARTVVLDTKSTIPSLRSRIESDIDLLALLTNSDRSTIVSTVSSARFPECEMSMASYIPADLIRRRPDIAEAEYNLAAAAARAGLAKKQWLPTLTLTGSVGTESHAVKNLFSGNSLTYSITPTLAWTVFDGFSRKYSIAEAKADVLAAADNYEYTLASARQEVSTYNTEYSCLLDEIEILNEAAKQSQESLNLSLELYKSGLSDFTNVMDAQISWLNYENSVISAKCNALSTLTTLYRAMGGGWNGTLPELK